MPLYTIVRVYAPHLRRDNETIRTDLTLEEAQEHCNDPSTSEKGVYFDSYTEQGRVFKPGLAEAIVDRARQLGL